MYNWNTESVIYIIVTCQNFLNSKLACMKLKVGHHCAKLKTFVFGDNEYKYESNYF